MADLETEVVMGLEVAMEADLETEVVTGLEVAVEADQVHTYSISCKVLVH